MKIGYFTERPYQDPRIMGVTLTDLDLSNDIYDPSLSADLFDRYIDEKIYAEEMGFDMLMLNEHHSTPFQLGGVLNVEACILARVTQNRCDPDLVEVLVKNIAPTMKWLQQKGMRFQPIWGAQAIMPSCSAEAKPVCGTVRKGSAYRLPRSPVTASVKAPQPMPKQIVYTSGTCRPMDPHRTSSAMKAVSMT